MITNAKLKVYDPSVDFEVFVYYDVLEENGCCHVFLYDNNFRFLGYHLFSEVSFRKCPDYWVSRVFERLAGSSSEGDSLEELPYRFPDFARERENGNGMAALKNKLLTLVEEP